MHTICLTPLAPGVYNDHKADHITAPPKGWAYIPQDFPLPSTFPCLGSLLAEELTYTREVEVEKDGQVIQETRAYTMMTVTEMTEGTLPEPVPETPIPKTNAQLEAENKLLNARVEALSDQIDFQEECLVEMASIVYG